MDDPNTHESPQLCWRCSLPLGTDVLECPHCGAPLLSSAAPHGPRRPKRRTDPVTAVLVAYGLLLLTSVVFGAVSRPDRGLFAPPPGISPETAWRQMAVFETIDTVIVLGCWRYVRSLPVPPRPSRGTRVAAWALAGPTLAAALALNLAYHAVLRDFVRSPFREIDLVDASPGLWARWLIVVCVQPAIVEELFFRFLAFRALLPHLSAGGTLLVSSIAFGMAHIYSPLSVPVLTLIGFIFGCAVLMTGRLWLAILLHFLHNFAITMLGWLA